MKKIILTLVCLLVAASMFAVDFSVGLKGDLGWNKLIEKIMYDGEEQGDKDEDYKLRFAGKVGAVFGMQFTEVFAFEPELMIHFGNGYSISGEQGGYPFDGKISFTTIELPLMFKAKLGMGSGYLAFAAGPTLNFAVGDITADVTVDVDGTSVDSSETMSFEDMGMKTFSLGIALGAEYGLPVGPGNLVLGARWEMDLTNNADNSDAPEGYEAITKRMAIMPSIAYMFSL